MKEQYFEEGQTVFRHGQPISQISFIVQGSVDLLIYDKYNQEHVLETVK